MFACFAWAIFHFMFDILEEEDTTGERRGSIAEERRERLSFRGSDRGSFNGSNDGDIDLKPKQKKDINNSDH